MGIVTNRSDCARTLRPLLVYSRRATGGRVESGLRYIPHSASPHYNGLYWPLVRFAATGMADGSLYLWDGSALLRTLDAHSGAVGEYP